MEVLYEKQSEIHSKYDISNYIFIVNEFNENKESVEELSQHLYSNICNKLEVCPDNYFLSIVIIKNTSYSIYVQLGTKTAKRILKEDLKEIYLEIEYFLGIGDYYKAWSKLISNVENAYLYPSEMIYKEMNDFIKNGSMIKENDYYFIFDEKNYTAYDVHGERMNDLYEKQRELYDKYGIANYIFVIEQFKQNKENLDIFTDNLYEKILKTVYDLSNHIITIVLIGPSSNQISFHIGKKTSQKISESDLEQISVDLYNDLKADDFYASWNLLLKEIHGY